MKNVPGPVTRRAFLAQTAALAAATPFAGSLASLVARAGTPSAGAAKVSIVSCRNYQPGTVDAAFRKGLDLIGGIGSLVKDRTVTVKLNLTGTNFGQFLGRPVSETYMTHPATATALASALFAAGARRVRFVECTNSRADLESTLALADWDVRSLSALGQVEFENTRNLGKAKKYAHLKVPGSGLMFESLDLNHSYEETDVLVSLCKLKQHITAGVTMSMKNLFGITPNALYGDDGGREDATGGRFPIHEPGGSNHLPGLKSGITSKDPTSRVPRTVVDICAARPIHLAVIDGITSMTGGEGPWCAESGKVGFVEPGVLLFGLNPVSTDAIGTMVMGFANPRALRGERPFHFCDNHLVMAEQAGLGIADPARIEVVGMTVAQAKVSYG
jgi:uncharacterized protein (DUF362 family)